MTAVLDRFDLAAIADWIKPGESVLDLGCGDGSLLRYLAEQKGVLGYGIENSPERVLACIKNRVNVLQLDLERGLNGFSDGQFHHVVMTQSLQAVRHTERMLTEMLRVGREAVVSFPNFGYRTHREAIARGHMPVSESLPYEWYDTPNVRFFTIDDFEALCASRGIAIRERAAFDNGVAVVDEVNLNASVAVYRLGRES